MDLIGKIEPSRKLNTKGCCFLCLQSENIDKTEELNGSQVLTSISIQQLLRHLQIRTVQSLDEKSILGNDFKQDIQVDLCENCIKIIKRFSVLFQNLEKIQLEMDYFLEKIHNCISKSSKAPELVQNYSKRMTSDVKALSQLAFVDNLRKQVAKESLRKANVPRLQPILTRIQSKLIKLEISKEACESSIEDFQGNYFPDDISPPSSPNSTANQEEDIKSTSFSVTTLAENEEKMPPPIKRKSKKGKYFRKDIASGMYECNGCDKKSKSSQAIADHYKSVHLKIRYKCDICNVSVFKQLSKVCRHKKICRRNLEKELAKEKDPTFKFICKMCGKRYQTKTALSKHERVVHKNIDRYPCDLCEKKLKSFYALRIHQDAIHFGKRVYCKFCSKSFGYKTDMQKHETKCATKSALKKEPQEEFLV